MNTVKTNHTTSVGFLIGMGAWSITFTTLIVGYLFYRLRIGAWLADYISPTIFIKALMNTGILLISSWIWHQFLQKKRVPLLILGVLSGLLFLKAQWDLWILFLQKGLTFTNSIAGSFLYLLTGFHALHVLIGLFILVPLGLKISQSLRDDRHGSRFLFALRFWDLLMLFWLVLLILIFFLK